MLLALNIGNTNLTFGGYTSDGKLVFVSHLYADTALSSDELTYKIVNMLELYGIHPREVTDVIFSSVVPALTARLRMAIAKLFEAPVLELGPGLKSGVRLRLDQPSQLGGELLCAVVGALTLVKPPLLVLNMDTAATLLAVDGAGSLVGGLIVPGPQLSLDALIQNTAQLPYVAWETAPKRLLGTNTADCVHAGIVFATAAMLDGLAQKMRAALCAPQAPFVATGQLPKSVRDACDTKFLYRETLILDGLYAIWQKNRKRG